MNSNTNNNYAVFFLNTGRCGSQFFASKLAQHYGEIARVEHEPNQEYYQPRFFFPIIHKGEKVEISETLLKHFDSIEETLKTKHYIETGWPAYGVLPHIIERFKGRVKIVHLFRHPVNVASSLTTHRVYSRGEWTNKMSITPADYGVTQSYLNGDQWDKMDEYSKCLFWWTEINRFALKLKGKYTTIPWHSLKFEEVFSCTASSNDALERLTGFLEFPVKKGFLGSVKDKVDLHRSFTNVSFDVEQIQDYDETIRLMGDLGYSIDDVSKDEILKRYNTSFLKCAVNKISLLTKRVWQRLRRDTD